MRDLGYLDTNIFVHALFPRDPFYRRCRAIVDALESGEARGRIDPIVVHELTYVLKRIPSFKTREDIHEYVRSILLCDYVLADDKAVLTEAVARWASSDTLSFADAWLGVLARSRASSVCSVNQRDFENVPNSFLESDG